MSTINYAIEITTDATTVTDAAYGITAGIFRFITGRPAYDGNVPYPTGEAGVATATLQAHWYEGWITLDGLSNTVRQIDITTTGDYGTLSGFEFTLVQSKASSLFWDFIETNDIYLSNRTVQLYVVIDNVFYKLWCGAIGNNPFDEKQYKFVCKDIFKSLHTPMPKTVITKESDGANDSGSGESAPLLIGDTRYARLFNTTGDPDWIDLAHNHSHSFLPTNTLKCAAAQSWVGLNEAYMFENTLYLITPGMSFASSELVGKYLFALRGSGKPDDKIGARIIGNSVTYNSVTGHRLTIVQLQHNMGYVGSTSSFTSDEHTYPYIPSQFIRPYNRKNVDDDTWWFGICSMDIDYMVSEGAIDEYLLDDDGKLHLYTWDSALKQYIDISDVISSFSSLTGVVTLRSTNNVTLAGDIDYVTSVPYSLYSMQYEQSYIATESVAYRGPLNGGLYTITDDGLNLLQNRNRNTSIAFNPPNNKASTPRFYFEVAFDPDADWEDVKDVYFGVDFSIENFNFIIDPDASPISDHSIYDSCYFTVKVDALDMYGNRLAEFSKDSVDWPDGTVSGGWQYALNDGHYIFLPDEFYNNGGTPGTFTSLYREPNCLVPIGVYGTQYEYIPVETNSINHEWFKIPDATFEGLRNKHITHAQITIEFNHKTQYYWQNDVVFRFRQFGVYQRKSVSLIDDDIYLSARGAATSGVDSNTVYGTIKYILETNDSIPTANIDYGNVDTERADWHVGRQIEDRKLSYDYLKELCRQSFVGMWSGRDGNRKMSAWRADSTTAVAFSSTNIIRDSIKKYEKTPIEKVYNDFKVDYNWDPGLNKYSRSIYITNPQAASFAATEADMAAYAGGLTNMYPEAKALWELSHASYDRINEVTDALPNNMSQLPWYVDCSEYPTNSDVSQYVGTNSSAYKYLSNLIEWTTRQKDQVVFSVPMTTANATLELLQPISFTDLVYTDNVTRTGWITKITIEAKKEIVTIEAILNPYDISDSQDSLIIERGQLINVDTITERGNQGDDTITETGV